MMICDEVMAGFGRCGEWFAFQKWGVQPDLVCFAKGVNSGYLPLGGVVISQKIADTFRDRAYPGGLTYSGHPLACASAVASINIFKEEGIIEHARMLGTDVIAPGLEKLQANHPSVGDVRGLGVFWAIELVTRPGDPRAARAVQRRRRRRQADERSRRGVQGEGPVAVHPLQPAARRAAVHHDGRRGRGGPRHPRRGARRSPTRSTPADRGHPCGASRVAPARSSTPSLADAGRARRPRFVSRLEIERQRGRREAARTLPAGPIIVISNHTSYADGVLLALACRRMGRSLRLLATVGSVRRSGARRTVARRLGFIKVKRGAARRGDIARRGRARARPTARPSASSREGRLTRDPMMWPERAKTGVGAAWRCAPVRRSCRWRWSAPHRVIGRRRLVPTLHHATWFAARRSTTRIGEPIDIRELMNIGAVDRADQRRGTPRRRSGDGSPRRRRSPSYAANPPRAPTASTASPS